MAVKIRLQRLGRKNRPFYRIVAAEEGERRNGNTLAILGTYDPKATPPAITVDSANVTKWQKNGAQPTDAVRKLLNLQI